MSGTIQRVAETAATERYEALLRASQTLISIRSSDELFSILAHELRAVANFCYLGVAIYDEQGLRAAGFSGPYEDISRSSVSRLLPSARRESSLKRA